MLEPKDKATFVCDTNPKLRATQNRMLCSLIFQKKKLYLKFSFVKFCESNKILCIYLI